MIALPCSLFLFPGTFFLVLSSTFCFLARRCSGKFEGSGDDSMRERGGGLEFEQPQLPSLLLLPWQPLSPLTSLQEALLGRKNQFSSCRVLIMRSKPLQQKVA
ncbi:hypothetical protein TIFTF001_035025 [Ficus carica]|uniref:Uncharacterized protein n=1 Tax=Ficus carica TaxID=3494 RepID=A0AA88E0Z0_FICCA|nr:hypothetical protein TIFTF001_035025 [Ficus carica]